MFGILLAFVSNFLLQTLAGSADLWRLKLGVAAVPEKMDRRSSQDADGVRSGYHSAWRCVMSHRLLSVLFSLAVMPALADERPKVDEHLIFRSADVDGLMKEVVDGFRQIDPPAGNRKVHTFLFCQLGTQSCYIALVAPRVWKRGSIAFVDADGVDKKDGGTSWFRLTPKWDGALKARIRIAAEENGMFPAAQRRIWEEQRKAAAEQQGG